jgi:hypothetical protein
MTETNNFKFHTKINGTTKNKDAQEIIRSFVQSGDVLHLEAEPENPFDKNAVAVYYGEDGKLGYIPKDTAAKIAKDVQLKNVTAVVSEITGMGKDYVGCNIELEVTREAKDEGQ